MPVNDFRIYMDNNIADQQRMDSLGEVKVEQAIGMATEAQLEIPVGLNEGGFWSTLDEDFVEVFKRIRVEVKVRNGEYVALIDGPIVSQRFELSASPNESKMVIVVQDDSVLLNQNESVEIYEDLSADQIAAQLFQQAGLAAQTDSVSSASSSITRYQVKRGTPMQLLKELARSNGMFVYVEPGSSPGMSTGYFKRPELNHGGYPELLLIGAERNINHFSAQLDGLRPMAVTAEAVDTDDNTILSVTTDNSQLDALGDEAVHEFVTPAQTLLTRPSEANRALEAQTKAAVDHSSWAYSANAEVVTDNYSAVLQPYRVVTLAGAGQRLSGDWLISQVTHTLTDSNYKQAFGLRRNARSSVAGSDLLGSVF